MTRKQLHRRRTNLALIKQIVQLQICKLTAKNYGAGSLIGNNSIIIPAYASTIYNNCSMALQNAWVVDSSYRSVYF
jgi:hypothetical protein